MQIQKREIFQNKKILLTLGTTEIAVANEVDADKLIKAYLTVAPHLGLNTTIRSIHMASAVKFEPVV